MKKLLALFPVCLFISSVAYSAPQIATKGNVELRFTNDTQGVLTIDNAKYENILENSKFDTASIISESSFQFQQDIAGQEPTQVSFFVRDNNNGYCYVTVTDKNADWTSAKECSGDLKKSTVRVTNPTLSKGLIELNLTAKQ